MSKISKKVKERKLKAIVGEHHDFLERITKTLYYGKLPPNECLSLPVTELAAEIFSEAQTGRSLDRLHCYDAARISRNASVSPCSLVLAVLYLEQLKAYNPEYLNRIAPSELFLVSLMVSSKFLHDDGEEDEVFIDEWAKSGGIDIKELVQLEKEFLSAMDWKVFVGQQAFWTKLRQIESRLATKEGLNRGWFTYTELDNLIHLVEAHSLVHYLSYVGCVLMATYTMGFLTIVGSMFVVSHIPGNCLQAKCFTAEKAQPVIAMRETEQISVATTPQLDYLAKDLNHSTCSYSSSLKCMNATLVLKTGIFLASIKALPFKRNSYTKTQSNDVGSDETKAPDVNYAWWSNPAMEWLARVSKRVHTIELPDFRNFTFVYFDLVTYKQVSVTEHIDKATKLRMQDQLEPSWHKEWTDTLKSIFLAGKYIPYCY